MSDYLDFLLDDKRSRNRKTEVWIVRATRDQAKLGEIRWFGRWRQYAFWPEPETIFNIDCLREIADNTASLTTLFKDEHPP